MATAEELLQAMWHQYATCVWIGVGLVLKFHMFHAGTGARKSSQTGTPV
jgi:hypothetical protein